MWPLLASVCVTSDLIRLIMSEKVIVPCAHSHMSSVALFLQSGDSLKGEIVKSVSLSSDPMKCGRWTWRRKTSGQDDIGVIVLLIVCRR